jgi:hypothetical protein
MHYSNSQARFGFSRESSVPLMAILAIKETEYVTKTRNGILPGGRSPGINKWTFVKARSLLMWTLGFEHLTNGFNKIVMKT